MILVALLGCVRLEEGDYAVEYADYEDACGISEAGPEDTTGELTWEDDALVFEFDGTDDDLAFVVEGATFTREAEGDALVGSCNVHSEQSDAGEMISPTRFEGTTELVYTLEGDCSVLDAAYDPPCHVSFGWTGTFSD